MSDAVPPNFRPGAFAGLADDYVRYRLPYPAALLDDLAAAALLGAPLGHDHALISLSDLHTPWEAIERRITAVAEADLVACFYNPASRERSWQLRKALAILAACRPPDTPVGWVRDASRPGESVAASTLAAFDPAAADMRTLVIVGSSRSLMVAGRMVTPRDYRWAAPS